MIDTKGSFRYISKFAITGVRCAVTDSRGETRSEDILMMAAPSDSRLVSAKGLQQHLPDGLLPASPVEADPTALERNSHHQRHRSQGTWFHHQHSPSSAAARPTDPRITLLEHYASHSGISRLWARTGDYGRLERIRFARLGGTKDFQLCAFSSVMLDTSGRGV